jgi:type IX secretion system PorP/SprF family membrane protein
MKRLVFISGMVFVFVAGKTMAQDIHFSQYTTTPMALNPALTGLFDGNYRLSTNYKNQWSAITDPFSTSYSAFDMNFGKEKSSKGYLNAGIAFFNDKAGKSKMGTNNIALSVSYNAKLTSTSYLAAGIQSAYVQNAVHTNGLKWDNQYNGNAYDANLPSGEGFTDAKSSYVDFAGGLAYTNKISDDVKLETGLAYFHAASPNKSFIGFTDAVQGKFTAHAKCDCHVKNTNTILVPTLIYVKQGPLQELNLGGMVKYVLGLDSKYTGENVSNAISFGGLYRSRDAVILMAAFDYKKALSFGFSYDINISKLTAASAGRGGVELSIIFRGAFAEKAPAASLK